MTCFTPALMSQTNATIQQRRFGETMRPDAWWVQPLFVFLGFSAFIIYSTWAAFHPACNGACAYWYGGHGADYLSPFYSPEFWGASPHALFGTQPRWWPSWLPAFSPAFLILWVPAGFRFTCYYYRGAYYKAFWADPVSCAVGEPRKSYLGENYLPLILQNIHRYFLYLAVAFVFLLSYDAFLGMWFTDATGHKHFGIGVGTVVLILNAVFIALYTFGCHSLRHLIGGFLDAKSKAPGCAKAYGCVSCLNTRHMRWAWISLFWVGFTDVYIRLCETGTIHDYFFSF
jgi:hypothetical protein